MRLRAVLLIVTVVSFFVMLLTYRWAGQRDVPQNDTQLADGSGISQVSTPQVPITSQTSVPFDIDFDRAIRHGSVKDVRAAIATGTNLTWCDLFGNTWLHTAAESQSGDKIRVLLDAEMDVNARNQSGETPLHYVIARDDRWVKSIDALLECKKLNLEVADLEGRTVLFIASGLRDPSRANRLLAMGAKDSIHTAALRGDMPAVIRAIEAGSDVNVGDRTGETPLRLAAKGGHIEVIRLLVERGGKIDGADTYGRTPLMVAAFAGQNRAVECLLTLGADQNLIDGSGSTFVDHAITRIRYRHGNEHGLPDELARRVQADARAKPHLRAVALLLQADMANSGQSEPDRRERNSKQAEDLYRRAISDSAKSPAGIQAAWNLAALLKGQDRFAEVAETLIPLLAEDATETGPFRADYIATQPRPDFRHVSCIEIAEAFTKLKRYPEALKYARLARDTFRYQSTCGTGFDEHIRSVADRVKNLEKIR